MAKAIAQIQNINYFVGRELVDILNPSRAVHPHPTKVSTGDHAHVLIKTEYNAYELSSASAYLEPPAGAPYQCRAHGTIEFHDQLGGKHLIGPKQDSTWAEISRHIHMRELTDAIAVARRQLAEASVESGAAIRIRLTDLIEKAKKWGLTVTAFGAGDLPVPIGTVTAADRNGALEAKPLAEVMLPDVALGGVGLTHTISLAEVRTIHDKAGVDPIIHLGAPVMFITNPGESISGMTEIPGLCVKIERDDTIAMLVTPDNSEPFYRDKLARRSDAHRYNCWDFNPVYLRERRRVRHLEEAIEKMADEGNADRQTIAALSQAMRELEDRIASVPSVEKNKATRKVKISAGEGSSGNDGSQRSRMSGEGNEGASSGPDSDPELTS